MFSLRYRENIEEMFSYSYLEFVLTFLIAAAFTYAAALKLTDLASFQMSIEGFGLAPSWAVGWISVILPLLEIGLAVALLFQFSKKGALWGIGTLTALFLLLLIYALATGRIVDCGCFGKGEASQRTMFLGIARNSVIIGMIFWLLREKNLKRVC